MNPMTWLTREWRTRKALKYIPCGDLHVDIGCGPAKYLLSKSPCRKGVGYDMQLGERLDTTINLDSASTDCVSMIAVIEHLDHPVELLKECHRILKPDGVFVITTPKAKGLWLMKIYDPGFAEREGDHHQHYELEEMRALLGELFEIQVYEAFQLGFNQLFVCRKK